jgi:hypothetical protein
MSKFYTITPHFTPSELARIAAYLQLAQQDILATARRAEERAAAPHLVERLDTSASDIADLRARIAALAASC